MSNPETALVPAEQQALAQAEPAFTLLQSYQMLAGDTPDEYRMDDDERAHLDDVKIRPTRVKMNGTDGGYSIVGNEDVKPVPELTAVILDKLDNSQVLFPKVDQVTEKQIWPEKKGDTDWPNFICRADSVHGVPRLHQDITEPQRAHLRELNVVGALNEVEGAKHLTCISCVHAQFNPKNGDKPNCSAARNLLVFDNLTKEPSVLQVKGTSIKYCDKHIAENKKKDRVLYADMVTLGSKPESEGTMKKWKVMTFTRDGEAGKIAARSFREIRQTMVPILIEEMRSGRNVMLGADEEMELAPEEREAAPAAPVGDTLPPVGTGGLDGTGMMPGDLF